MAREQRFWLVLVIFALLGALEWSTLSAEAVRVVRGPGGEALFEVSIRGIALMVLGLFAFRSWLQYRREKLEARAGRGPEEIGSGRE